MTNLIIVTTCKEEQKRETGLVLDRMSLSRETEIESMSSLEETYSPFARTLKTSGTRWLSTSVITKRPDAINKEIRKYRYSGTDCNIPVYLRT